MTNRRLRTVHSLCFLLILTASVLWAKPGARPIFKPEEPTHHFHAPEGGTVVYTRENVAGWYFYDLND